MVLILQRLLWLCPCSWPINCRQINTAHKLLNKSILPTLCTFVLKNVLCTDRDGDIYAALRDCHTALTLDPSHNKAHFRQARCLYELRWCQEALSCLQHFKARFPEQAEGNPAKTLERDIKAAAFAETEGILTQFCMCQFLAIVCNFHVKVSGTA